MTAYSPTAATSAPPLAKDEFLALAPGARLGTGVLPDASQLPVVVLTTPVSALDSTPPQACARNRMQSAPCPRRSRRPGYRPKRGLVHAGNDHGDGFSRDRTGR